jgi:N-ethylmaleimide reductase
MGGSSKAYAKRVMPSETAAAIEMQIANQSAVKNLMLCVMKNLFEPCQAGQLQLASRIVMAPLTRNRAPQALANALMAEYYAQRANPATGAGLIITEATAISHQGQGYADVPGIWSAEQVKAWQAVTAAVHAKGGKIVVQLWHVGRISHTSLQPNGQAPVAPSAIVAKSKTVLIENGVPSFVPTSEPRALELAEIPGIVSDYRHAAKNAIDAGFDGIEVHAANGYLIDQFLRADSNHRTDAYGGSIENRTRLLKEVMLAVTQEIGGGRCGIRISPVTPANDASDSWPQALFEHVANFLGTLSLAYVHTIEGSTGAARDFQQGEAPFDYTALKKAYQQGGGHGAWMLNNAYDRALADQAIADGADLIAFGKSFIANPDLAARLKQNGPYNTPDRATFYGGLAAGYTDYPSL